VLIAKHNAKQKGEVMSKQGKEVDKEPVSEVIETAESDVLCKVTLTQEELIDAGQKLADQYAKMQELDDELEQFKSQHKSKVAEVEGAVGRLSKLVANRYDYRPVCCIVTKNFTTGIYKVRRTDTGDFVEDRRMTSDESQRGLALFNQKKERENGND
jgi:hypothetical protein